MSDPAAFSCTCGALAGQLAPASRRTGTHVECFCVDCRATQLFLGQPDPRPGGVHLFQTTPDCIHIRQGRDQLGLMRLSPNGMFRWYATCCNAPMFNTLKRPGLPFVAVLVDRLADPSVIGKVRVQGFLPGKDGKRRHKGAFGMITGLFQRMIAARLSGRWQETPFFDIDTGYPRAQPRVLTKAERDAFR